MFIYTHLFGLFVYMSSFHSSPIILRVRTRFCNAGPSSPLQLCEEKHSTHLWVKGHCPCFMDDLLLVWMIWKFTTFFWVEA